MASQDFRWVAEAVAVQRDTGGNLNEVLDNVGETIRERNHIREKVRAFGRGAYVSQYVLMALPIVVGLGMTVMNPGYMAPLFDGTTGSSFCCRDTPASSTVSVASGCAPS